MVVQSRCINKNILSTYQFVAEFQPSTIIKSDLMQHVTMKFWSEVEFACHFGKIHPPLQYTEIHLSWWICCRLPYSPIWWIHFQFDPWRLANFLAIRSWNKGCNGRINSKAPLWMSSWCFTLPWIDIHILRHTKMMLMTKILHLLIRLSHYSQPLMHPNLFRMSSISSVVHHIFYWRPRLLFLQHEFPIPKIC